MNIIKSKFFVVSLALLLSAFEAPVALAASIPLQNLSEDQFKSVIGDMSASFLHTSVSGAGTLGRLWGFEVGLIGGATNTPHLQAVATEANNGANVDANRIPNLALLGRLGLPLGLSAEATFLPSLGGGDFKAREFSLAGKWTATDVFGDLPLDLAARASYTAEQIDFNGTVSGAPASYTYKGSEYAAEVLASKNFFIFEPYVALGVLHATGQLSGAGMATLFNVNYTASNDSTSSRDAMLFRAGTEIKLFFGRFGIEYANAFAASRWTGKLSAAF